MICEFKLPLESNNNIYRIRYSIESKILHCYWNGGYFVVCVDCNPKKASVLHRIGIYFEGNEVNDGLDYCRHINSFEYDMYGKSIAHAYYHGFEF